ncbi:MAG: hypothetical protein ABIP03_06690 [Aquihabitans sp.]
MVVAALVIVVAGVAGGVLILRGGGSDPASESLPATASSTTQKPAPKASSRALLDAACAGRVAVAPSPPITEAALTEVSGVAATAGPRPEDARAWVLNDSGDQARIYGIRPDSSVQTVEVLGAANVDWEDLAVDWEANVLWVADTGGNIEPRTSVQLYRMKVPGVPETSIQATRVDVDYPDGPHDVEAIVVEPAGTVLLFTKEPGQSSVYRVDPGAGGRTTAQPLGRFTPTESPTSLVTGAAFAADHATLAIRTYGSTWLYPVNPGQSVVEALRDTDRRCSVVSQEVGGEAVAFLPDNTGWLTVPEGTNPIVSAYRPAA